MAEALKIGERAPGFRVIADDGKDIALADYRGKNVVLYFFPKALTPG
jgi:peroxiredoxin Q/BCP